MAQPVSTFTPTRFPEPIAPRAAEASSASHGEGTADFGAHLDAQKAAPRPPAPEKAPVHHAVRHANRDIEDTRREAARDANPVKDRIAAKADALAKKYHAPKDKDHAPETADRSDETGIVTCPVDTSVTDESSPRTKTKVDEYDAGTGKVVCPQVGLTEGEDATELGADTPVDTIEILVSPICRS